MGSWWETLLSPAKNWVGHRRLRRYGSILSNYLKGITPNDKAIVDSSQMKVQRLEEVEKIIGYGFNNRSLLCQAFTYPSYQRDCVSYERLEYVGDSVLNLLITKEQFSMYPELPPGLLTPLRAANVDTEKLARVAIQHNFHRYIRLGNPVVRKQIQTFIHALPKHPLHSHGLINAPKVLADVVESTVGAVFVDSNYSIDTTWEDCIGFLHVASDLLKPIITPEMLQKNPVKKLFEICQKYKLTVKLVDLWSQEGTYKVFIINKLRGKGMCREKKEIALNRAANDAYKGVVRSLSDKSLNQVC
ncbi:Ribonuclease 3-like protein 3 [Sesamum alatum]|uniref:Ribonuclease 3-like protein 3 n=1 Tax=Sesamum alatum TaxID=300844 RepID=A0AAE2CP96_9LAMI|nr:Ribonuclease 3-like protein 3 [Sesamum alatum]